MNNSSTPPFVPPPQTPSAIPIVAPINNTTEKEENKSSSSTTTESTLNNTNFKRLCRNVIIHGFCKFQDKGCEFKHETEKSFVLPQQMSMGTSTKTLENSSQNNTSIDNMNASIFVPKSASLTTLQDNSMSKAIYQAQRVNASYGQQFGTFIPHYSHQQQQQQQQQQSITSNTDPYFYMHSTSLNQPQYHQNAPTLPHVGNLLNHQRLVQSFFIPDNLREKLVKRNEVATATYTNKNVDLKVPDEVDVYHSLYPLDDKPGNILGHSSWLYKCTCRTDGKQYTMIRIEGFRLVNEQAMTVVKRWKKVKHANIVSIHEAFTTRAFNDSSLVFIFDYYPCSITLYEAYFSPQAQALLLARFQATGMSVMPVPETTLWSFIIQIASALKAIHHNGLSARSLGPNRIIMTSKNRLRINHASIMDVLQYDTLNEQKIAIRQQEDLLNFGKLILSLACHNTTIQQQNTSENNVNGLIQSFEYMSRFYSPDLKSVAYYLLGKPSLVKSIDEVFNIIGPRLLTELNHHHHYTDTLEANLGNELENSRLVRLLTKLGFINERPEFDNDPRWSESGDRYMIKLFRDYLFHQVNEVGLPIVDMTHVISCLNKLDVGSDEKILLTSRDDQTTMIISYKELKSSIASVFNDIYSSQPNTRPK
ncbi:uncharacterized protein BX663DRAFT_504092 [Cokeromyces recurvatus]|uniref:uncharacterized protein n=1 Tax=Cokeromyces recurvatus TaxID=90255 RepID=UPI00221FD1CF|nr:uncharacterized protein BX663DRAFT_504092 [Cokeromyces recurvatus]KAI7904141.1 hypothetical protein BX663DRAFT_504092 [Cokeromyces recurvatus]